MFPTRQATTRECRRAGSRCWISDNDSFVPRGLKHFTPATIARSTPGFFLWIELADRCLELDPRALVFSQEYQTRTGKWLPEWHSKVRLYLLRKLAESRALDHTGSSAYSARHHRIADFKFKLRRNGWFADDDPDD